MNWLLMLQDLPRLLECCTSTSVILKEPKVDPFFFSLLIADTALLFSLFVSLFRVKFHHRLSFKCPFTHRLSFFWSTGTTNPKFGNAGRISMELEDTSTDSQPPYTEFNMMLMHLLVLNSLRAHIGLPNVLWHWWFTFLFKPPILLLHPYFHSLHTWFCRIKIYLFIYIHLYNWYQEIFPGIIDLVQSSVFHYPEKNPEGPNSRDLKVLLPQLRACGRE